MSAEQKPIKNEQTPINRAPYIACQCIYSRAIEELTDLLNWAYYLRERGVWLKGLIAALEELQAKLTEAYQTDYFVNFFLRGVEPAVDADIRKEKEAKGDRWTGD